MVKAGLPAAALAGEIKVSVGTGFFACAEEPQPRRQSVPANKPLRRYCDEPCLDMETCWELVRRGEILSRESGQVNEKPGRRRDSENVLKEKVVGEGEPGEWEDLLGPLHRDTLIHVRLFFTIYSTSGRKKMPVKTA